ncbi:MAG: hypothetical protein ACOX88_05665 [Christensenellales bacterium]
MITCTNCRTALDDDALFCRACGQAVVQKGGYMPQYAPPHPPEMAYAVAVDSAPMKPIKSGLGFSITLLALNFLTCSYNGAGMILVILSVVFSGIASGQIKSGNHARARSNALAAKVMNWINLVFLILWMLLLAFIVWAIIAYDGIPVVKAYIDAFIDRFMPYY